MTIYDAAMVGVILLGMIWGAMRGITWQIASIASLVLGYVVAYPVSSQLAPHFPGAPVVARALALLATYAGVSGGVFLMAWMVRATLRQWKFEAFDRHLGMILGGLEGALLGLVGTMFVLSLSPDSRTPIFASPAGHVVSRVLDTVEPILPDEIRSELAPFWSTATAAPAVETAIPEPALQEKTDSGLASGETPPTRNSPEALIEDLVSEGQKRINGMIQETNQKRGEATSQANDRHIERR